MPRKRTEQGGCPYSPPTVICKETATARAKLADIVACIPVHKPVAEVLSQAAKAVEQYRFPAESAWRKVWLGEDWCMDREGLIAQEGDETPRRTQVYDVGYFQRLFERFRALFQRITATPAPGTGTRWLQEVEETLAKDASAHEVVTELKDILVAGKPRLYVCGDYNAGKSSFIKRLLLDAGNPIPPELHVRGNPTTEAVSHKAGQGPWKMLAPDEAQVCSASVTDGEFLPELPVVR